ncbi:MAG: hypothetical protein M0R23_09690 [Bacteroidales bacterium]|nr:hypothetical protein [Bacteroidales bacterium]
MEVVRKEISSLREIGDVLNKPLSEIESSVVSTLESKITSLINSKGEGTKTAEELKEINNQVKELEKQYNEAKSAQAYYEEQEKFTEKLKSDFDSIKNSMPDLTSQFEDIKFDKDTFGTSEVDSLNKSLDATKNKINGLYNTMKEYPIGSDIYNAISQEIDSLKSIYDEIAIKLVKQDIKDIVKESNDNIDIQSELSVIFNEDSLSKVQNEINEIRSRITSLVEKKYEIEDMAISDSAKKSLIGEVQSTIAEATAELNSLKSVEIQAKVDVISTDFESKIRELEQYGEVLGKNIPQAKLEAATNQLQELISLESELIGKADLAPIRAQIDATIEKIKQLKQEALDAFAFETTTNLNVELENDSFVSSLLGENELEQVEGTISQLESAFSSLADKRSEALSEGLDTTQLDVSLVSLANQLNIEKEKLDVLEAQEKAKEELAALEKEIEAILSGEEFNKTLSIDLEFGELTGAKESEQLETQIGAYEGRLRELLELKQKNSEQGLDNGEIQTEISETVSELDKLKLKLEEVKNLEIYNDSIKKFNEELATSTEYIKYMTQGATDLSMQMGDAFLNQLDDLVRFRSELVATGKPIRDIDQNIKDTTGNIKEWADALLATDFSESLNGISTSVSNIGSYFETAKTIYDVRKELELTTAVSKELGDTEEEVGKKRYEAIQSALEALIEYKNNLILTGQGSSEEIGKLNQQIKEYQEEKSKYEEQEKQKAAEVAVAEAEEESLENLKAKLEEISDIRAKAFERKFDLDSFLGKPESIENRVNKIVSSLQELYEMEFDDLSVDVENAEGAEGSFRKTIDNTSKAIAAQQSAIAELRAELKKLLEERFKDVLEDLRVSNVQSAMSFEIFGDELGNLTNQLNSTKTAIEDLLVLKQEAIESPAIEWTAENEDTLQGLKNTYEELEEQVKKAEKIKSITSDIAGTVKSAFGDFVGALKSGTSLDKAMKDLKKNLKNNLKEAILNALLESLIQSAAMQEKFEKIGNMIFEALEDGVISSSEQTGLNDLIGDITDQADQIAGVIGSTFEGLDIGIDSKDLFDIATLESSLSSAFSQFATDLETMSFDKAWKKTAESLETEIKKSIINAMIESIIQSAAMKSKMEALGEMIGKALEDGIISGSEQANIDILTGSLLTEAENAAKVIAELLNSMGMSKDSKNKQKTQTFDAVSNNDSRGLYFEPTIPQADLSTTVEDAKESIDLFSNYLKEIATGDVYGYSKLPDGIMADPGALWDPIEKFEETAGRLLSSINDKTKYSVPQETEERLRELLALQQENSRNKQEPLYYALTIDSGAIVINSSVENEELLAEEIIKRIKSEAEMKVRTSGGRLI